MTVHRIAYTIPKRKKSLATYPIKASENNKSPHKKEENQQISSSFILSSSSKRLTSLCSVDCFAVRLAEFIINIIHSNIFPLTKEGRFNKGFYRYCLQSIDSDALIEEIGDRELVLIYIKQIIAMLKVSGILYNDNGISRILDPKIPKHTLYIHLFNAFWNQIEWEEIFVSNTELARDLKRNRYFLLDLTLKHSSVIMLETISNDFFEITGFSGEGYLFMISFLDFYFFTWLRHFGIIRYTETNEDKPVSIQVTDKGRKFIKIAT